MSKLIELPLTGLRVKLSDGVDYHNDGAVDMGSHPQDLCERYRVKSALQELSPTPLLDERYHTTETGGCIGLDYGGRLKVHIFCANDLKEPAERTFVLGHEETHVALMWGKNQTAIHDQFRAKLNTNPFFKDLVSIILSDQVVRMKIIKKEGRPVLGEIFADFGGVIAVGRKHGVSPRTKETCLRCLSQTPAIYGPGLCGLFPLYAILDN
ncbi:MAG: hypothetical protein AABX12_00225 [Nanoarchaeota archaeon]